MVRDIKPAGFDEVKCMPGANWERILRHIHDNKNDFACSLVYVMIGPVRFTKMIRGDSLKEVIFKQPETSMDCILRDVKMLKESDNIFVVMCTLTPMDFQIYNNNIARHMGFRQIHCDSYARWNRMLLDNILATNNQIIELNKANNVITPFVHKQVLLRKNKRYVFRPRL